jgi:hypothetical protein
MPRRSVRATPLERDDVLAGDGLITAPVGVLTHAVTIGRPPRDVWPWLVQMGADRAGWYSYDVLDNGRRPSATRIVPELQRIGVGTLVPAGPGVTEGFHVLDVEPGAYVVLGWVPDAQAEPMVTWAFVLRELGADASRLVVRVRASGAYPFYGLPPRIGMPLIRIVHWVMERKQLLGIARRAEAMAIGPDANLQGAAA